MSTFENDDQLVDGTGRNPTQRQMDEEGVEDVAVDVEWEDAEEEA